MRRCSSSRQPLLHWETPRLRGQAQRGAQWTPETIRIWHAQRKAPELPGERRAEKLQRRYFERAVAEAMISPREDQDARFARVEHCRLQRSLDCLGSRTAEDDFTPTRTPPLESEFTQHFAQFHF